MSSGLLPPICLKPLIELFEYPSLKATKTFDQSAPVSIIPYSVHVAAEKRYAPAAIELGFFTVISIHIYPVPDPSLVKEEESQCVKPALVCPLVEVLLGLYQFH
jgi:hypothetical protein